MHQSIKNCSDENSLPWNPERKNLTAAEAIFGIVEGDISTEKRGRNLASRVKFTDAIPITTVKLSEDSTILKILDSPKPPSPSMYFHSDDGCAITADNLNLNTHKPNGRKHYLPHNENKENWVSKYDKDNPPQRNHKTNWNQFLKVNLIPPNTTFKFSIQFENLSEAELGLLLTTLDPVRVNKKEKDMFLHRLGLGKPLGLGEIELNIKEIEIKDRIQRYTLSSLLKVEVANDKAKLNDEEIEKLIKKAFEEEYINPDTLRELKTLYNPENVKLPVCYPYKATAPDYQKAGNENKGYKWFVKNKSEYRKKVQSLGSVKEGEIPVLHDFSKNDNK